ncbi:MAG: rhomboid family intramembrane serine protease [Terracidiphilus sp.]
MLVNGEWWRIVTAMFVHVGILHLATNMWCLWNLGLLAEPLMGSFGLFAVYILTGAAGNLLSTAKNWMFPSHDASGALYFQAGAGASGAVFGIAGALIVLLRSKLLPVPPEEVRKLRKSVIYFAAINLVIGLPSTSEVDLPASKSTIRRTSAVSFAACFSQFLWCRASVRPAVNFSSSCA